MTVTGMFNDLDAASAAADDLMRSGFSLERIGAITKEAHLEGRQLQVDESHTEEGDAAGAAAVSGTVIGGLIGALIGGAAVATGFGLIAVGTLAGAVATGAGVGAVSGGLLGSLVGAGIPEEHAEAYAAHVEEGRVLLTVKVDDESQRDLVTNILNRHGAQTAV